MSDHGPTEADREARLDEALAEYLQAADAGHEPDRAEFLTRYPQFAAELKEFFDDRSLFEQAARPWVPPIGNGSTGGVAMLAGNAAVAAGARLPYFGDYELLEEIARGGMGIVYKARQISLNRFVAVKMILAGEFASAADVQRFRIEAENAANLEHLNIVPIYEVGQYKGHHYYSMKLIEGGKLSQQIPQFTKDHRAAARVMATVARAVHYAHQRGVLHRDLKPGNILLDSTGQPQVTDLGLARRLTGDSHLTLAGAILGTPCDMAPEQARSEKDLTTAADVYSLGAILYELVTGQPPFRADTVLETLGQVRDREPIRPSSINSRIRRDLETICLKCLQKDPQRRYASANDLADDLERWLKDEPVHARPIGTPERVWRWCRRRPALAISMAAVLCLAITIGIALEHLHRAAARLLADETDRLMRQATIADMQTQSGLMADNRSDPAQALLWFASAAHTAEHDPERARANRLRLRSWGPQVPTVLAALPHPADAEPVELRFHPSGMYLMTWAANGKYFLWDWPTERRMNFSGAPDHTAAIVWSPDGQWLALAKDREVLIYSFPMARALYRIELGWRVNTIAFSPDGHVLAIAGAAVRVWDCRAHAFVGKELALRQISWNGGGWKELAHPVEARAIGFSPRNDYLATTCDDKIIHIFRFEGATLQPQPLGVTAFQQSVGPGGRVMAPLFQDEGKTLVTVDGRNGGGRLLSWWGIENGDQRHYEILGDEGVLTASADARHMLVGADGRQGWIRVIGDRAATEATWQQTGLTAASFSRDGHRIALACDDAQVHIRSSDSETFIGAPMAHQAAISSVVLSDDGALVATAQRGGLVRVWAPALENLREDRPQAPSENARTSRLTAAARITLDCRYFMPFAYRTDLQVYDALSRAPVGSSLHPDLPPNSWVRDAEFSPDGKQVAVVTETSVEFWDWRVGMRQMQPVVVPSPPVAITYSPKDVHTAAVLCSAGELLLIDPTNGRLRRQVVNAFRPKEKDPYGTFHPLFPTASFDPAGRSLIILGPLRSLQIRDAFTGDLRLAPLEMDEPYNALGFSPDGSLMSLALEHSVPAIDLSVSVRRTIDGKPVGTRLQHPSHVFRACFSPDGSRLVTSCQDGVARVWDWQTGRIEAEFQHTGLSDSEFAGNGRWIVTAGGAAARLWDIAGRTPLTPWIPLTGKEWSISTASDNSIWLARATSLSLRAVRLIELKDSESWTAEDECLRCELIAGEEVLAGGGIAQLTPAQWLERWRQLRSRHPEYPDRVSWPGARTADVAPPRPTLPPLALPTPRSSAWPMWGGTPLRNMISPGSRPPIDWNITTAANIKWAAKLGSKSYGEPVVADGVIYVGTNNESHRNRDLPEDGGVLMAFDADTGEFLWQRYSAKLPTGRVNDWPGEGMCSPALVQSGRLWYCTNRCEVVCLDVSAGKRQRTEPPVLWSVDMMRKLGVFPHNMTRCSIAAYRDYIYVITGNGVDDTHNHVVAPQAPDIICFDKNNGQVVWSDNSPGPGILHGQWASVAIATVGQRTLVIAPMGDAWVYAYEAETGKIVWKFDLNPKQDVYPQTRNEVIASPCIVDWGNGEQCMYIANGQDPEHGEGRGHLYCVDITKEGDISSELEVDEKPEVMVEKGPLAIRGEARKGIPNPNSGIIWEYEKFDLNHDGKLDRSEFMNRTISTACVTPAGLCFIPDFSGFLHCLDARTGQVYWTFDMESATWTSPMWVDGKVFITDEDGDVFIFADSNKMKKLSPDDNHLNLGGPSYCSPIFVNDILYLADRDTLFAIRQRQ